MENLDIEKLERQNVYKTPENFFAEMQQKVLMETTPKKEAKIIKLNWAYSAAAAITLLFGITFFVTQNNGGVEENRQQSTIANNKMETSNPIITNQQKTEAVTAYQNFEKDLTSITENNQKEEQRAIAIVSANNDNNTVTPNKKDEANPEVEVDQILANFTSTELADVGKNVEQDIYLDLYN